MTAPAQPGASASSAFAPEGEISNREALAVMGRALRYMWPLRWRFLGKLGLDILNIFPLVLMPYPIKIVVDHVIGDRPITEPVTPFPGVVQPFVNLLDGMSRVEIAGWVAFSLVVSLVLIGFNGNRRDASNAQLAQGLDAATVAENRANSAWSYAGGLLGWIEFRLQLRLTQLLNHFYRSKTFEAIHRLPLTRFDDQRIGDAIYRVMYDTPNISSLCYTLLLSPITRPIHIALGLYILLGSYSSVVPIVGYAPLLALPIAFLATLPFGGLLRRTAEATRTTGSTATATIEEGMTNILAVQSLGGQGHERARFERDSWQTFSSALWYSLVRILVAIGAASIAGLVFLYVVFEVTDALFLQKLSAGDITVIIGFYLQIAGSMGALGQLWIDSQNEVAALKRVFYLMDQPGEAEPPGLPELGPIRQGVQIRNVTFAYADGTEALRNVSADLPVGRVIGLVGPAGAGKTTFAYLVPRFVDATSGTVTVDGVDVTTVTRESLRKQVSFVFQETVLLDATIAENIRLAKPDASELEIRRACEVAGAAEFIERLPQGYDTPLGRDGGKLSIGQRQRLSIARALVRNAPILILDEPTSALDPETEHRLVAALQDAARSSLVIVIAHRLSTIRSADEIFFIEAGEIRERGSHTELMLRPGGAYRRFVELQSRGAA